jgi:hypothetical protein
LKEKARSAKKGPDYRPAFFTKSQHESMTSSRNSEICADQNIEKRSILALFCAFFGRFLRIIRFILATVESEINGQWSVTGDQGE